MKTNSISLKELLFLKSILLSNFLRLNFPLKISFAVTYKCNLRCKMCNIWKKSPPEGEITLKEIDTFFKNAPKFYWVGITGGEPFLRRDLPEIADIVLTYCYRLSALHFATNGQLSDKIINLVRYIRKKNAKLKIVFTVSIDGPPALHNEIRGQAGAWENAIETFIRLKDMESVKAQIGFTLTSHNLGRFEETFSSIREFDPALRFDDININIFQRSNFYYENQDMPGHDTDELVAETKKILNSDKDDFSVNNFLRRKYLRLYPRYVRTKKYPLKCQALSSTCFLDPYGNLFPCLAYSKKLLNIKDIKEPLASIWNKDYARKLSSECSNNICPSCWSPCDAYSAIGGSVIRMLLGREQDE